MYLLLITTLMLGFPFHQFVLAAGAGTGTGAGTGGGGGTGTGGGSAPKQSNKPNTTGSPTPAPTPMKIQSVTFCLVISDMTRVNSDFVRNAGRIDALPVVSARYPDVNFSSRLLYVSNTSDDGSTRYFSLITWIKSGCNILNVQGNMYKTPVLSLASLYPSTLFILHSDSYAEDLNDRFAYPNVVQVTEMFHQGAYVAGVVTGCLSVEQYHGYVFDGYTPTGKSKNLWKVGLITKQDSPYSRATVNAFLRGMQTISPMLNITVVEIPKFTDDNVRFVSKLLIEQYGVNVLYASSRSLLLFDVITSVTDLNAELFLIGTYVNFDTYAGDEALSSITVNWAPSYIELISKYVDGVGYDRGMLLYDFASGVMNVTEPSLDVSPYLVRLFDKVRSGITNLQYDPLCATPICTPEEIFKSTSPLTQTDNIAGMLRITSFRMPDECPIGTTYSYNGTNMTLLCTPCPSGMTTIGVGATICIPCSSSSASPNHPNCDASDETQYRILISITTVVTTLFAFAMCTCAYHVRRVRYDKLSAKAPLQNPVTLVYTSVDWSGVRDHDAESPCAYVVRGTHAALLRTLAVKYQGYEVRWRSDCFLFAFSSANDALNFAVKAQLDLMTMEYPQEFLRLVEHLTVVNPSDSSSYLFHGLRVRMACHTGDLHILPSPLGHVDYEGPAVNLVIQIALSANGGQILITQEFYEAVMEGLNDMTPVTVTQAGRHVFRGKDSVTSVFSVIPSSIPRHFPPVSAVGTIPQSSMLVDASPTFGHSVLGITHLHDMRERARKCFPTTGIPFLTLEDHLLNVIDDDDIQSSLNSISNSGVKDDMYLLKRLILTVVERCVDESVDVASANITWRHISRALNKFSQHSGGEAEKVLLRCVISHYDEISNGNQPPQLISPLCADTL